MWYIRLWMATLDEINMCEMRDTSNRLYTVFPQKCLGIPRIIFSLRESINQIWVTFSADSASLIFVCWKSYVKISQPNFSLRLTLLSIRKRLSYTTAGNLILTPVQLFDNLGVLERVPRLKWNRRPVSIYVCAKFKICVRNAVKFSSVFASRWTFNVDVDSSWHFETI